MRAEELIDALQQTGTGGSKLDAARRHLAETGRDDPHALLEDMRSSGQWPEGTAAKARMLLAGVPAHAPEMQGKPPDKGPTPEQIITRALDQSMGKLADAISGKHEPKPEPRPEPERQLDHPDRKVMGAVSDAAEDVAGRHADKQIKAQADGVGNPQKPSAKK